MSKKKDVGEISVGDAVRLFEEESSVAVKKVNGAMRLLAEGCSHAENVRFTFALMRKALDSAEAKFNDVYPDEARALREKIVAGIDFEVLLAIDEGVEK